MAPITRVILTSLVLAAPLCAAPVPPAPRLTEAHLLGTWDWEWGEALRGPATFYADGTYRYDPHGATPYYVGRWWLERDGRLVLMERSVGEQWVGPVTRFELRLSGHWPKLAGTVTGTGTRVMLSGKRCATE